MKIVACVQPNYIPWKGYFDMIRLADEFILLDDVQYTWNDWRNRNIIKTPSGLLWLTIPVVRGRFGQLINEKVISDFRWRIQHWKTLWQYYLHAPYFDWLMPKIESLYLEMEEQNLSRVNEQCIRTLSVIMGLCSTITLASHYMVTGRRQERVINLCKASGATHFIGGPTARAYLSKDDFRREGVELMFMSYDGYPEYPQLYPPFEHRVSVLDLLFSAGPHAQEYMVQSSYADLCCHESVQDCSVP